MRKIRISDVCKGEKKKKVWREVRVEAVGKRVVAGKRYVGSRVVSRQKIGIGTGCRQTRNRRQVGR